LENSFGGDVLGINDRVCVRANARSSVYCGKNAVFIVEVQLHQRRDLPEVAHVFCGFCALENAIEDWNRESAHDADRHDYRMILLLGGKRKRKRAATARLLDKGFCIRCM